jgi:hypothetical protein
MTVKYSNIVHYRTSQCCGQERDHALSASPWLLCHNAKRFYIGEVLDLYKKGNNSRYGSVDSADNASQLAWLSLRVYLPLEISAASVSFFSSNLGLP